MSSAQAKNYVEAYQAVCGAENPYKTYEILNELERMGITTCPNEFSGLIPVSLEHHATAYLRQIVLRSNRSRANPSVMAWLAGEKIPQGVPYPKEWRDYLRSKGMPVSELASILSFFQSQCRAWYRALISLKDFVLIAKRSYKSHDNLHVFSNVPPNAIPVKDRIYQSSTLLDWIRNEKKVPKGGMIVIHAPALSEERRGDYHIVPNILPALTNRAARRFYLKAAGILARGFIKWACGNWKASYVAAAAIENAYFEEIDQPAAVYYFSNSEYAVRPFWTYTAEKRGSDVVLYFYSANINCFYIGQKHNSPPSPGYISMSWPHYWVLDDEQSTFLRDTCHIKGKIAQVGSIDFTDTDDVMPQLPSRSVALFDIQVFDRKHVANMALIAPYYIDDVLGEFLFDVADCVREIGGVVAWKQKRDVPRHLMSEKYFKVIDDLCSSQHVIRLPAGIAARRVIERAHATISIPFTSTAVLAWELGRPSAFYDPTGGLTYTRGLARSLPVLGGRAKLKLWLEEAFDKKQGKGCA